MDLKTLLIDLSGLSDADAEAQGRALYDELFLQGRRVGVLRDVNGECVVFHEDRYEHAFRTSSDRVRRPYAKDVVARTRIERIRWIKEIIEGRVPGSVCFLVRPQSHRLHPPDRLVIAVGDRFIIWLQPMRDGGWKFSSAYETSENDIHRYKRKSIRRVWSV